MYLTSTGLRNAMLKAIFTNDTFPKFYDNARLRIYSIVGDAPATADAALGSATLITTISDNATGDPLAFDTPVGDTVAKLPSQTWRGTNVASGTIVFWRLEELDDDGTASTTKLRIQGMCGTVGSDMNIQDLSLVSSAPQDIDYFYYQQPTAS